MHPTFGENRSRYSTGSARFVRMVHPVINLKADPLEVPSGRKNAKSGTSSPSLVAIATDPQNDKAPVLAFSVRNVPPNAKRKHVLST
jgi:hypothetical protein